MLNVKAINDERLSIWKTLLIRKHSTPIMVIRVGHDNKAGEVTLLVTEERTNAETILFLEYAIKNLKSG